MKYSTLNVLGYNVFTGRLQDVDLSSKVLINTISPNSYGLALHDSEFKTALRNTDVLVLDGIGIAFGSLLIHGKDIHKIAGQDCFDYFIDQANKNHWRVFFLGSSMPTLQKIAKRLAVEYPDVEVQTYSPPFKQKFTEDDNNVMIHTINLFRPHVLFIGLTAPKQEKWAYQNKLFINASVISTIGNVFDWYAGNSKRPSEFWIKLRLEWLARMFMRPEIFRRNTKNQLLFLRDLFLHVLNIKTIQ